MDAINGPRVPAPPSAIILAWVLSILYGGLAIFCASVLAGIGHLVLVGTSNSGDPGPKGLALLLVSIADVGAAMCAGLALWAVVSAAAAGFARRGAPWSRGALTASFGLAALLKVYLAWDAGGAWAIALALFALLDLGVVVGTLRARAHFGPRPT